ncbi:hypothetical protein CJT87_29100 [Pseudomonas aeruginosa]|nr:hypothetical protein CJT87_29100 [Pseudomonas aeruginosa]
MTKQFCQRHGEAATFSTESAGSSPSLPDGSNPSAAIVQSASDVQCSRLLKTTARHGNQGIAILENSS